MTSRRHNVGPQASYLDAARACILDVGWRRTTLTEVARRAGVSRMTIYRAWPDMPAVLADLMTREWGEVVARAVTEADATLDPQATAVDRIVAEVVGHGGPAVRGAGEGVVGGGHGGRDDLTPLPGHQVGQDGGHVGPGPVDRHPAHPGPPGHLGQGGAAPADVEDARPGGVEVRRLRVAVVTK